MSKKRTKLIDRKLPDYTRGEEIFNMVSHIVGGGFGVIALATCVIRAFLNHDAFQIVSAFIYGISMVLLYTMSSVYHGLKHEMAKKVMQVIDHCSVFLLIAGTYTPITLVTIREAKPWLGWTIFGVVWGVSALGIPLNAIARKKYNIFSMICYLALGWCIILPGKTAIALLQKYAFMLILLGGILYTVGAALYGIAGRKTVRYMHSVFHIFVVFGSITQYLAIIIYILA